jgi:hypothetical protein
MIVVSVGLEQLAQVKVVVVVECKNNLKIEKIKLFVIKAYKDYLQNIVIRTIHKLEREKKINKK